MDKYDAGLINDYGGGNVGWWQDYIRSEIERCNDFYQEKIKQLEDERRMYIAEKALFKQQVEQLELECKDYRKAADFAVKENKVLRKVLEMK